jgi:hypothetical protein
VSTSLLAVVTAIYLFVAVEYVRQRRYPMALVFVAYALANLGFILDLRR